MSKTKNKDINADENANEKFKSVANPRIKKALYELNRLVKMAYQPTYMIYDVDAQKVLDASMPTINAFVELYQKLASGETLKTSKKEIEDIF